MKIVLWLEPAVQPSRTQIIAVKLQQIKLKEQKAALSKAGAPLQAGWDNLRSRSHTNESVHSSFSVFNK